MSLDIVVRDRIYGDVHLSSPIVVDLLQSPSLTRLEHVAQSGIPRLFSHAPFISRFEHTRGVMLLLRRLGASEVEQVAGLLHDVSHTAFSHTIDWVLNGHGETQNFQDEQHERYLLRSDIPGILASHGYSLNDVYPYERYTLLEQPIPDLCADRIDYAMREFPEDVVSVCLNGLTVHNGVIVFRDESSAVLFAEHFLERQRVNWGGYDPQARVTIFAAALREALAKGILVMEDLFVHDEHVMQKLLAANNDKITHWFELLGRPSLDDVPKNDIKRRVKFRYVDPLFLDGDKLVRVTVVRPEFARRLEEERVRNAEGVYLPEVE